MFVEVQDMHLALNMYSYFPSFLVSNHGYQWMLLQDLHTKTSYKKWDYERTSTSLLACRLASGVGCFPAALHLLLRSSAAVGHARWPPQAASASQAAAGSPLLSLPFARRRVAPLVRSPCLPLRGGDARVAVAKSAAPACAPLLDDGDHHSSTRT
jgi:hypothetical protein